ncbi:MAG: prepilin peptidase [Lachnospiraceae bacterium]|nr:prepilin peptidase [Lachnospiraceae bacterium]
MSGLWMMRILPLLFLGINTATDLRKRRISLCSAALFSIAGVVLLLYLHMVKEPAAAMESIRDMAFGVLAGVLLLLLSLASDGAIGMGDALVSIVMGFYLGLWRLLAVLMGSFLACGMVGMLLLWQKKADRKSRLPFVPFMLLSYLGLLCMEVILGW